MAGKYEIYADNPQGFRFRLKAGNGEGKGFGWSLGLLQADDRSGGLHRRSSYVGFTRRRYLGWGRADLSRRLNIQSP
jgi:hypothetical protein